MSNLPLYVLGTAAIGIALWLFVRSQRELGAAGERSKQAEAEAKARDIADQVDNDVGAIPPDKRREELKRWKD